MVASKVSAPLVDLGDRYAHFRGILAPVGWKGGTGVTTQFLEDAQHYHEQYFNVPYVAYTPATPRPENRWDE